MSNTAKKLIHTIKSFIDSEMVDFLRTVIAFPFGLLSETFARVALLIQPDLDVDFNYLSKDSK